MGYVEPLLKCMPGKPQRRMFAGVEIEGADARHNSQKIFVRKRTTRLRRGGGVTIVGRMLKVLIQQ